MPMDCFGGNHVWAVVTPIPGMTCICGEITEPARALARPAGGEGIAHEFKPRVLHKISGPVTLDDECGVVTNPMTNSPAFDPEVCGRPRPAHQPPARAEGQPEGCGVCGGRMVLVRGRAPGQPQRAVCPQCQRERLDLIRDYADPDYGRAYTHPPGGPA